MATGGETENGCSLINVEGVTLQGPNEFPRYRGIVVFSNNIFVTDWDDRKVGIHGLQDGRFLYESDRLESLPRAICLINDSEIAVILNNGLIKFMSTHTTPVIRWTRDLHVQGGLDEYHCVVSFNGDLVVVCGVKEKTLCWCIVSSIDGHVVGTIHQICKVTSYPSSFITAKHNIIYISCYVDSPYTGVYAYDVQNPSKYKYSYKHKDLERPRGIAIDQHGSLFVCNVDIPYDCIHHLTSECQLVFIVRQGIIPNPFPYAIFCDEGLLYVTCYGSNHITRYRTQYPDADQYSRLQWLVMLLNNQVQQKPNDKEQMPKEMEFTNIYSSYNETDVNAYNFGFIVHIRHVCYDFIVHITDYQCKAEIMSL